jgi:DNA-binding SARP family transcriptional activator
VSLVAVVFAVPLVLYLVGGAPISPVGLSHISRVFTLQGTDPHLIAHWVVRGALTLAWVSWLWMTVCVTLELRSWITGRSTARLPASRTIQSLAACLVGTAMALSSLGRLSPPPSAPGRIPTALPTATMMPLQVIDDLVPATKATAASESSMGGASGSTSTVGGGRGDRSVPVGLRFGGSSHPGPDPLGFGPPEHGPLPDQAPRTSDPASPNGRAEPSAHSPARSHVVQSRETLWSIATDRLGSPPRWREIAEINYGVRQADGGTLTGDHWIRPGWTLRLPLREGQAPDPPRDPGVHIPETEDPPLVPVQGLPLTPVGAGVIGAGVVSFLDRMRSVQQRHRTGGMYIKLPTWSQRSFEQRLRLGGGRAIGSEVDAALRLFAQGWSGVGVETPVVKGVTVSTDAVELMVDAADGIGSNGHLFDEVRSHRRGRFYRVERSTLAELAASGQVTTAPPAPLLVSAGSGEDGLIMVNLESVGTLVVNGDRAGCEGVIRALALELATSFWSGRFDLVLAGFGAELERFDRVATTADAAALINTVCQRRWRGERQLRASGHQSFAQARSIEGSGRWDPLAVICGPTMADADIAELLGLASDPRLGIAVVAVGEMTGAAYALSLSGPDHPSTLDLLRSVVIPQRVEEQELEEIAALVDTAGNRLSVFRSEEPYVSLPLPMPAPSADGEQKGDPLRSDGGPPHRSAHRVGGSGRNGFELPERDPDVEVRVLGPIEVRGAAREFSRAWARELVVYLAMHPNGASNEAWATALWPDRLMAPSSLHSTASVARRSLGQASDGTDHLPRSHGRLALADSVGTDWDRFVALADSEDPARWQAALALVRGRPFDGLRSSDWPILEGIGPAMEAAVVDLSGRLAGARLAAGDPGGAREAARKGLLVSPYDERLYRMLMRAADLDGNPAGVEAVMAELVQLVADDIEPFDSVHPSTMDLYRSLTRRRTAATRGG